ncbi:unnamed protein product [Darwinula stevensoni]|uniref:Uncharacterized protein n=1 Tax=Darwinula stevensoni TaxID=69355 RepID=A0A7R8X207_9CRUS|nr:unnamed protein product [Darwinula stevensoni]CAG0883330.1 unnamed protein product [Darwinula stevensoni]
MKFALGLLLLACLAALALGAEETRQIDAPEGAVEEDLTPAEGLLFKKLFGYGGFGYGRARPSKDPKHVQARTPSMSKQGPQARPSKPPPIRVVRSPRNPDGNSAMKARGNPRCSRSALVTLALACLVTLMTQVTQATLAQGNKKSGSSAEQNAGAKDDLAPAASAWWGYKGGYYWPNYYWPNYGWSSSGYGWPYYGGYYYDYK